MRPTFADQVHILPTAMVTSEVRFPVYKPVGYTSNSSLISRACLDQHLITIRSREVLGVHVRSKTWVIMITLCRSAAVQARSTTDTMACYAAAPALLSTVDANNCRWYHIRQAEGMEWVSRAVAAAAASRQEMSGEMRWDGYTDDRQQPVINDPIMLHGDNAWCVYGPFFL